MWVVLIASAAALELDVGVGTELTVNEPFLNPVGLRAAAVVRPLPWLGAGLSLAGYPVRVHTTLYAAIEGVDIVPDAAPIVASGSVYGTVRFARGPIGRFDGALDLVVGLGAVHTVDDCAAIFLEDDPACLATQNQLHVASVIGLGATIGQGRWGLRLRGERWAYTETIAGTVEESKDPVWVGADVILRFGGP